MSKSTLKPNEISFANSIVKKTHPLSQLTLAQIFPELYRSEKADECKDCPAVQS
jgi:hypothetical protein